MAINFNYNTSLKLDSIQNIFNSSEDLSGFNFFGYGNLTTHTSTNIVYSEGIYRTSIIGSNLKPTTATNNRSKKADDMQTFLAKKNERVKKIDELKSKENLSEKEQKELMKNRLI